MRIGILLLLATTSCTPTLATDDSRSIFEQRILPILNSRNPSSCAECHLSGVDLKQYIGKDAAETFAALRDRGLIDLKKPAESEILRLIARESAKPTLVSKGARKQELEAFQSWIEAAVRDPQLHDAPGGNAKLGPAISDEVIAHTRQDRVLERFTDLVWSEVERCSGCHSPAFNQKQVEEHGEQVSWIVPKDPAATLARIVEHELLDLEKPDHSLILLKPTKQVDHGGGIKMMVGDRTYTQFRSFIEDYARSRKGEYADESQLPKLPDEVSVATGIWFRIENLPAAFSGKLLAVEIFPQTKDGFSESPWAVADRLDHPPGDVWQQTLSLVAPRGSQRAAELQKAERNVARLLPAGRYLVKVYVDQTARLKREYPTRPGLDEFVGEFEVESKWSPDYGSMTKVAFEPRRSNK
jgi:hypothetical protein